MSSFPMDDLDEEEVVFDQTTLLTRRFKASPQQERSGRCARVTQTLLLCAAFFGLGLCLAMPGPTLLDLEARTNTNTSRISQIFTGRSIGYLFGSIVSGFLYDRVNQNCLLSLSLIVTAAGTALAPWSKNFTLLMVFIALQGISMGFLDTGGNVFCMTIWGRSSPPYMQALHFSFGLGAFVAPLLAEPFLSVMPNGSANPPYSHLHTFIDNPTGGDLANSAINRFARAATVPYLKSHPVAATNISKTMSAKHKKPLSNGQLLSKDRSVADGSKVGKKIKESERIKQSKKVVKTPPVNTSTFDPVAVLTAATTVLLPVPQATTARTTTIASSTTTTTPAQKAGGIHNYYPVPGHINDTQSNNTIYRRVRVAMQNLTNIQFAYLAIAAYLVVIALCFMVMCCCSSQGMRVVRNQDAAESEYMIHKETKGFRVQILVLMFFFYFLYVGMEVTYGGLIMSFAVKYLGWTKQEGTLLTSVFWGSFALARGLAIFFGVCLSPALMLVGDLVMTCLSLAGLVMALDSNHTILWFCTGVLGGGMASIFPTGITWAERYMHMTGKATSVLVVGSSLGEMVMPALTGYLFETKGPMWLLYVMFGAGLLSMVLYIIMQNLASNKGERYEKLSQWLGSSSTDSGNEEPDIEMDSLASNSTTNLLEIVSPPSSASNGGNSGKKKVSFNLPKEMKQKGLPSKYMPSFLGTPFRRNLKNESDAPNTADVNEQGDDVSVADWMTSSRAE